MKQIYSGRVKVRNRISSHLDSLYLLKTEFERRPVNKARTYICSDAGYNDMKV